MMFIWMTNNLKNLRVFQVDRKWWTYFIDVEYTKLVSKSTVKAIELTIHMPRMINFFVCEFHFIHLFWIVAIWIFFLLLLIAKCFRAKSRIDLIRDINIVYDVCSISAVDTATNRISFSNLFNSKEILHAPLHFVSYRSIYLEWIWCAIKLEIHIFFLIAVQCKFFLLVFSMSKQFRQLLCAYKETIYR